MDSISNTTSAGFGGANSRSPQGLDAKPDSQRPAGGETLARAAAGAHHAVDAAVAKVAPVVDTVHDKVESVRGVAQGVKDKASDLGEGALKAKDEIGEWMVAARDAVRAHPFAAIGVALLLGVAYSSIGSKRR